MVIHFRRTPSATRVFFPLSPSSTANSNQPDRKTWTTPRISALDAPSAAPQCTPSVHMPLSSRSPKRRCRRTSQKEIDKHNDSLTDQSENMEEIIFEDTEEAETE